MTDYNKLRALALVATPGPWATDRHLGSRSGEVLICLDAQDRGRGIAIAETVPGTGKEACNAAYIAAANPATVLALLDEVEAAHASRREAQARVAELTEQVQKLGRELHRHKLDTARLDWLADRENAIGNVQLPSECVLAHPESLRAAIDMAMRA